MGLFPVGSHLQMFDDRKYRTKGLLLPAHGFLADSANVTNKIANGNVIEQQLPITVATKLTRIRTAVSLLASNNLLHLRI